MRAPEQLITARLTLLRPRRDDAARIFEGYASGRDVTRLLGWPRHRSVADSAAFVDWSDEAWSTSPAGPYLALAGSGELVGSTGLDVETPWRAATGFVLARSAWGQGYATEIATAMVQLAATLGLARLYAHPGVGALDRPAAPDLDRGRDTLDRDLVVEAEDLQQVAGLGRVVAAVQMHGWEDVAAGGVVVLGQRADHVADPASLDLSRG